MRARSRLLLCLLAAGFLAATLTACGDDTPPAHAGTAENPLVAHAQGGSDEEGATRSNEAASATAKAQDEPGFQALLEQQSAKPRNRFSPCRLVSQPRASDILGAPVEQPVEAPQGPTCIYRTRDGEQFVTVAVQTLDFRGQQRLMDDALPVDIPSRDAYCGTLGEPTLNVRLSGSRVLSVGAPCRVAARFATAAVARLDS